MRQIHRTVLAIQDQIEPARKYPGSGRLKAGIVLLRAGIRGAEYLGDHGGDHRFRLPSGHIVGIDLVSGRANYVVGAAL